jgi:hypothetical protein
MGPSNRLPRRIEKKSKEKEKEEDPRNQAKKDIKGQSARHKECIVALEFG